MNTDQLVVEKITVDGGQVLYRRLPMSRGRAFRMRKRTSHVLVSLSERSDVKAEKSCYWIKAKTSSKITSKG